MASPIRRTAQTGLVAAGCLILVFQASASRLLKFDERNLVNPGLHSMPMNIGEWKSTSEQSLDQGIVDYLQPDEYILRDYIGDTSINVFVAYFKSLEKTYGPHAPRICLPGSGWLETSSKIAYIPVEGPLKSLPVNQLTYEQQNSRILVLYWYQNNRDAWADEFWAKLRLLPDLIKYRRSDVSLVRLVTPMLGATPDSELPKSIELAKLLYSDLEERFTAGH